MIFTMYNIFEIYSEVDGESFYKKQIFEKIFLKVLISPNFVIFLLDFGTKMEQKITKFGLTTPFKNYFFKNLFLHTFCPSNSE